MDVGRDTEEDRRVTGNEVGGEYYSIETPFAAGGQRRALITVI